MLYALVGGVGQSKVISGAHLTKLQPGVSFEICMHMWKICE